MTIRCVPPCLFLTHYPAAPPMCVGSLMLPDMAALEARRVSWLMMQPLSFLPSPPPPPLFPPHLPPRSLVSAPLPHLLLLLRARGSSGGRGGLPPARRHGGHRQREEAAREAGGQAQAGGTGAESQAGVAQGDLNAPTVLVALQGLCCPRSFLPRLLVCRPLVSCDVHCALSCLILSYLLFGFNVTLLFAFLFVVGIGIHHCTALHCWGINRHPHRLSPRIFHLLLASSRENRGE